MAIVIDAQIVKGFFQETVLEIDHELSASPMALFDISFRIYPIHVDDKGTFKHEWRAVVEPEWFDTWYTDQIRDGAICEVAAPADQQLKKQLAKIGFPATGRDIWYARVCNQVSQVIGFCVFVSEDLDFYEPEAKRGDSKHRSKVLINESGSVRKYFKKEKSVFIKPVVRFNSDYQAILTYEQNKEHQNGAVPQTTRRVAGRVESPV